MQEVEKTLQFSLYVLRKFGFTDFQAYLATMPEKKHIGSGTLWKKATETLRGAIAAAGLDYQADPGGGAFYGPKIDIKIKDSLGREWQCSTIQFDFNLPERFHVAYIGKDGKKHTPFMIHRALFGSIERFTALLIEHYNGAFPLWLAPVQAGIVPVKPEQYAYCRQINAKLKRNGIRTKLASGEENLNDAIKALKQEKIPYILLAGKREQENRKRIFRKYPAGVGRGKPGIFIRLNQRASKPGPLVIFFKHA